MDLSVIIVNYNVKYFLEQCLYAVQNAALNLEVEIFVVDNNSSDGSREYLLSRFPAVNFIWNNNNTGFAKANNQALALAIGDHVLFLNPDTIVPEDGFEKCIAFLKANSSVGALGVRMIDGSGKFLKESKRSFPSPLTSFYKLTGMAALFPRSSVFARYYLGRLSENENHEVDVLAGAFMMIPRKILELTGGFDERFFMYGEDVDISYRIQRAGYKNIYFSACSIIHFKGESTGKGSLNYVLLFYKAMSQFVKKHYSGSRAGIFVLFVQLAIRVRGAVSVFGRLFRKVAKLFQRPPDVSGATPQLRTILVCEENDYERLVGQISKTIGSSRQIIGRVNCGNTITKESLGELVRLPYLVQENNVNEIIYCEKGTGFKAIIETLCQIPAGVDNKFYASGSNSIVGSNNKDINGEFIILENTAAS